MRSIQSVLNKIKDAFSLYTISIFPLPTEKGIGLLKGILDTFFHDALGHSYEEEHCVCYVDIKKSIKIKVYDQSKYAVTVNDCILSCYKDDLVIFDASIEGDNHEINNYRLANALQSPLEHVLVVSRTYLPLNIYTYKTGGFPSYKQQSLSNESILKWLESELSRIDFHILRDRSTKGIKNVVNYLKASKAEHDSIRATETSVFISFRTKYAQLEENSEYKYSVSELARRIETGCYGEPRTVKYLDNGSLVFNTELLTQWKAWQLLCIIDKEYISYCDEMWIYASDDYLNSWWTMGEQILFSYLVYQKIDKRPSPCALKKLMVYYPKEDRVEEIKPVPINDYIAKSICRILIDCHPQDLNLHFKLSHIAMRQIVFGNEQQFQNGLLEQGKFVLKIMVRELYKAGMSQEEVQERINQLCESEEFWSDLNNKFVDFRNNFHNNNLTEEQIESFLKAVNLMQETTEKLGEVIDMPDFMERYVEMLSDKFLSEEFWEQVVYNDSLDGNGHISNLHRILTEDRIMKHLSMDFPGHKVVSNIFDIKEGDIVNGKKVVKMPSRYIYMPLLPNEIDPSPTNNSLYEMPVYILE